MLGLIEGALMIALGITIVMMIINAHHDVNLVKERNEEDARLIVGTCDKSSDTNHCFHPPDFSRPSDYRCCCWCDQKYHHLVFDARRQKAMVGHGEHF